MENKKEQQELKNKEFLEKLENKNISNVIFKPEGLGALEFDLMMTGKDFKTIDRPFRIERVSTDTFFKLLSKKEELTTGKELLTNFIAQPIEARDIEFFNMDQEALETVVTVITEFQQTPFLFIKNFEENKGN
ncbi:MULTISPECIES: hypothetical protein [Fusobacterium]|uniref:Uncharacterized protein n=2 Tax=Fusobacterium TaxID=848 RepID=A0A2B7YEP0_FUSNP|nr:MULTISPECIES: hypothetical protein [Fusobacterium]KUL98964.1 hypothetical protein RO03_05385 [Fusobacterium nucleatum subsp. nucleatum]PGH19996.1 hypothetical protein RN96_12900 [Fusobacterium polymorphum]PHI08337.1 hypothetical protein CBG52_09215 [Fusobacterium polymorphum]